MNPLTLIRRPLSSVFGLLISGFMLFSSTAVAQDNPFAEDRPPVGISADPAEKTIQPSAGLPPGSEAMAPKKKTSEEWEQELLRDPFWPVGFFPPNWQRRAEPQSGAADMGGASWKAASTKLQISGTSQLGDRAVAIINGELKGEGEKIEVLHEGRIYQWEIVGIDAAGQIQLKKLGIR